MTAPLLLVDAYALIYRAFYAIRQLTGPDGQPVNALFTLISPTVKAHLHLLSRLAYALRDPDFKSLIVRQAGRDEILEAAKRISSSLRTATISEKEGAR